jgi:putative transposase
VRPRSFRLGHLGHHRRLNEGLEGFAKHPLARLLVTSFSTRPERVCEDGVVMNQALLIAIGIDWDGRRQRLAVEKVNRERRSSWKDFLLALG